LKISKDLLVQLIHDIRNLITRILVRIAVGRKGTIYALLCRETEYSDILSTFPITKSTYSVISLDGVLEGYWSSLHFDIRLIPLIHLIDAQPA